MTESVLPSIKSKKAKVAEEQRAAFNMKHKAQDKTFPEGTVVLVINDAKHSKEEQKYIGPFIVKRRNQGGAYIVVDPSGKEYKRTKDQLKPVYHEVAPPQKTGVVERIVDHRETNEGTEYLTKWKRFPEHLNSWVKESDFDSTVAIQRYWKNNLQAEAITTQKATQKTKRRQNASSGHFPLNRENPTKKLKIKFKIPKATT